MYTFNLTRLTSVDGKNSLSIAALRGLPFFFIFPILSNGSRGSASLKLFLSETIRLLLIEKLEKIKESKPDTTVSIGIVQVFPDEDGAPNKKVRIDINKDSNGVVSIKLKYISKSTNAQEEPVFKLTTKVKLYEGDNKPLEESKLSELALNSFIEVLKKRVPIGSVVTSISNDDNNNGNSRFQNNNRNVDKGLSKEGTDSDDNVPF